MQSFTQIIIAFGYVGIAIAIFAESGFLLGFFLPGDSLVFAVGILASRGYFNIWILVIIAMVAAILGDSFGYSFGRYFGPRVFSKEDSKLFKKEYVNRTENFYHKYGSKTIILARFVPIIRTFAPVMAGVGKMEYKRFLANNVVGGVLWAGGVLLLSYFLGSRFKAIDKYFLWIVIIIILISVVPIIIDFLKKSPSKN